MKYYFQLKLPENESHDLIIDTLYESWKIYNNPRFKKGSFMNY